MKMGPRPNAPRLAMRRQKPQPGERRVATYRCTYCNGWMLETEVIDFGTVKGIPCKYHRACKQKHDKEQDDVAGNEQQPPSAQERSDHQGPAS